VPDHEAFASRFHNGLGHLLKRVDFEDSLNLSEEPIQQPEVSARDANNGRNGFFGPRLLG